MISTETRGMLGLIIILLAGIVYLYKEILILKIKIDDVTAERTQPLVQTAEVCEKAAETPAPPEPPVTKDS